MIELFNDEQIQKSYLESERYKAKTEGLTEGRMEGRMEGRTEGLAQAIHSMKRGHFSDEDISRILVLPLEQVRSLADSYKPS